MRTDLKEQILMKFINLKVKGEDTFIPKNEDAIRPLLDKGIVRPVRDVFSETYINLTKWLKSYPVTAEEIQEAMPELYQKLQDAITKMDNYFLNKNLKGFNEAMGKVKSLYLEALKTLHSGAW